MSSVSWRCVKEKSVSLWSRLLRGGPAHFSPHPNDNSAEARHGVLSFPFLSLEKRDSVHLPGPTNKPNNGRMGNRN